MRVVYICDDFTSHDDIMTWKRFRVTGRLWRESTGGHGSRTVDNLRRRDAHVMSLQCNTTYSHNVTSIDFIWFILDKCWTGVYFLKNKSFFM